jgi:hypothetical protein
MLHLKDRIGVNGGFGLWTRVANLMRVERPREPLAPEMISVLSEYFSKDVELLGQLLGRDLRQWLAVNRESVPGCQDKCNLKQLEQFAYGSHLLTSDPLAVVELLNQIS